MTGIRGSNCTVTEQAYLGANGNQTSQNPHTSADHLPCHSPSCHCALPILYRFITRRRLLDPCDLQSATTQVVHPHRLRTRFNIIWTCVSTIFICTWVAIHPNIPTRGDADSVTLETNQVDALDLARARIGSDVGIQTMAAARYYGESFPMSK